MYKKGDKIVLIDNDDLDVAELDLYGVYVVEEHIGDIPPTLLILKNVNAAICPERFISLIKFRKQKIEQIRKNMKL